MLAHTSGAGRIRTGCIGFLGEYPTRLLMGYVLMGRWCRPAAFLRLVLVHQGIPYADAPSFFEDEGTSLHPY